MLSTLLGLRGGPFLVKVLSARRVEILEGLCSVEMVYREIIFWARSYHHFVLRSLEACALLRLCTGKQ